MKACICDTRQINHSHKPHCWIQIMPQWLRVYIHLKTPVASCTVLSPLHLNPGALHLPHGPAGTFATCSSVFDGMSIFSCVCNGRSDLRYINFSFFHDRALTDLYNHDSQFHFRNYPLYHSIHQHLFQIFLFQQKLPTFPLLESS